MHSKILIPIVAIFFFGFISVSTSYAIGEGGNGANGFILIEWVDNPNLPPVANAGENVVVQKPSTAAVPVGVSATDPEGLPMTYFWANTVMPIGAPRPNITNGTTRTPTFSNLTATGTYTFSFTATNNLGLEHTDLMNVRVVTSDLRERGISTNSGPFRYGTSLIFEGLFDNATQVPITRTFNNRFQYRWGTTGGWTTFDTISYQGGLSDLGVQTNESSGLYLDDAGTLQVRFCTDASDQIDEQSEANNCTAPWERNITSVACMDGNDNDRDGETDYPDDPGCNSLTDNNEVDPPPTGNLIANPRTVAYDETTNLTWNTNNADSLSCSVTGGPGIFTGQSGNQDTPPLQSTVTYTLACGGAPLDFEQVTVLLSPSLTASAYTVEMGDTVVLTYNTNGQTCTLNNGIGVVTGAGSVTTPPITAQTAFTLDCPVGDPFLEIWVQSIGFET